MRQRAVVGVEQDVVAVPGRGAKAGDGQVERGGLRDGGEDLFLELGEVGGGGAMRAHREGGDFLEGEQRAVEGAEEDATAIKAEIAGEIVGGDHGVSFYVKLGKKRKEGRRLGEIPEGVPDRGRLTLRRESGWSVWLQLSWT